MHEFLCIPHWSGKYTHIYKKTMYVFGKFKTSMVLFHSMHNAYQDIGDQITGLKYRKQHGKVFHN